MRPFYQPIILYIEHILFIYLNSLRIERYPYPSFRHVSGYVIYQLVRTDGY
jgi:hypothetical protein